MRRGTEFGMGSALRALRPVALIAVIASSLFAATSASAAVESGTDLHDARYCEILELKGGPPDGKVVVWNTIGLNDCPAAKWDSLDASELAAENGDTLVILNGPRHFLMDSADARTGKVRSFHGLRMRRVATIPITTPADLVRTPYTDRTIDRTNTWKWRKGRRVYELLAPDGSTYMMQAYSQIVDPELRIGDLEDLGSRLDLPPGWTYRSRVLGHSLTLRAEGEATIIQDDLQNTYQRLPAKPGAKPVKHVVDISGETKNVGSPTPGTLEDKGTVRGKPFGPGDVDVLVTLGGDGTATGTFEIDARRGSILGSVDMTYTIAGDEIDFAGTATFTGGTGRYRGITAEHLKATDHNTLDGQNGRITLKGKAKY